MFTDQVELADLQRDDPEYVDLLRRVLAIQADCEIGGPHLYVEAMLPSAPTRIDQLVVARTATEEIDHFRKFARLAGDSPPPAELRGARGSSGLSSVLLRRLNRGARI